MSGPATLLSLIDGSAGLGVGLLAFPSHTGPGQQALWRECLKLEAAGLIARNSDLSDPEAVMFIPAPGGAASEQILLPCPFCGAELVPGTQGLEIREDEGWHTIGCGKCGVEQGFVKATREEAIAAWNRRHGPPDLEAKLKAHQAAIECGVPASGPLALGGAAC